ncbi:MAG: nucleotidyl transferase AbiEii/AbiGii toxin family protein [Betaproteobacteria bacterium]
MTNTLLDFSQRPELALHARVVADVEAAAAPMGITPLIAGAFARDLQLHHGYGIRMQRQTEDIDFALAVPDWESFAALRAGLIAGGAFEGTPTAAHRLRHRSGWPVDLVPFQGVESPERKIAWPPRGEIVMDVFGFREALAAAHPVALPGNVQTCVVSLPALALLKIVCWQDRHYASPRKDAHDLQMILRHYLAAGNEPRLWNEFSAWTQDDDFDYELAGPRMLGQDIRHLLDPAGIDLVAHMLQQQTDSDAPGLLPNEMNSNNPEQALDWLNALRRGLQDKAKPNP